MRIVDNVHLKQPLRRCEEDKPYTRGIEVLGAKAHGEDGCVLDLPQAGQKLGKAFLPAEEQGDTLSQPGSVEITYIPIGGLYLYLICVIGWFSHCVVGRKDSSDMGAAGVCECMCQALEEHKDPPAPTSTRDRSSPLQRIRACWLAETSARAWMARPSGSTTLS